MNKLREDKLGNRLNNMDSNRGSLKTNIRNIFFANANVDIENNTNIRYITSAYNTVCDCAGKIT